MPVLWCHFCLDLLGGKWRRDKYLLSTRVCAPKHCLALVIELIVFAQSDNIVLDVLIWKVLDFYRVDMKTEAAVVALYRSRKCLFHLLNSRSISISIQENVISYLHSLKKKQTPNIARTTEKIDMIDTVKICESLKKKSFES